MYTDPVALPSTMERQSTPRVTRASKRPDYASGVIEPLWQSRRVTQSGRLTQITIPLEGSAPQPDLGPALGAVLDERWTGRRDLLAGARVLSVVARVARDPLSFPVLELSLVTDDEVPPRALAKARVGGELRRALRDLRRGYALPLPLAA